MFDRDSEDDDDLAAAEGCLLAVGVMLLVAALAVSFLFWLGVALW
jgi:hypothetical protein